MSQFHPGIRFPWRLAVVLAIWIGVCWDAPAHAYTARSWEIGLDVGAEFSSRSIHTEDVNGDVVTIKSHESTLDAPLSSFRAGYFLTDAFSLESTLGLSWTLENPDTRLADWQVRLGLGATYAFAPSSPISPFLTTGVSTRYSGSSNPVFGVPIQGGVRIRIGESQSLRVQSGIIANFAPEQSFFFFPESANYRSVSVSIGWSLNAGGPGRLP